jgi:hypothetical protein
MASNFNLHLKNSGVTSKIAHCSYCLCCCRLCFTSIIPHLHNLLISTPAFRFPILITNSVFSAFLLCKYAFSYFFFLAIWTLLPPISPPLPPAYLNCALSLRLHTLFSVQIPYSLDKRCVFYLFLHKCAFSYLFLPFRPYIPYLPTFSAYSHQQKVSSLCFLISKQWF